MVVQLSGSQPSLPSVLPRLEQVTESADVDAIHTSPVRLSNDSTSRTPTTDEELSTKSHVQNVWDTAINKSMGLPNCYENVAALIIKWAAKYDDLGHGPEVEQLEALFKDSFRYRTRVVNLGDCETKPQLQLNYEVNKFVNDHDGQNNLLIVYYTGHGSWDGVHQQLKLHAKQWRHINATEKSLKACWGPAENAFMESPDGDGLEGDVLAIFDACYASNVQKSVTNDARTYQLIAASSYDRPTAPPGKYSFTTALIKSLKELLHEYDSGPFTVHRLAEQISKQKERQGNPCLVHTRLRRPSERDVRLAPLPSEADRAARTEKFHTEPYCTFFTLRFALVNATLTDEQIKKFAEKLWNACRVADIQARRIHMTWEPKRLKAVGLMAVAAQFRRGRPTLDGALSVRPSVPPMTCVNTGPSSTAIPFVHLVDQPPTPDPPRLSPASSSLQEEETAALREISQVRRLLGQININTALLVVLMILMIAECMSQVWWHDILAHAQDRAKDLQEVVNALLARPTNKERG